MIQGAQVSIYALSNNIGSPTSVGTLVDSDDFRSVFMDYELERSVTGTPYRQVGTMMAYYDGSTYNLSFGNYDGSDLLTTDAPTGEKVRLTLVSGGSGQYLLHYESGNLAGSAHSCNLKISITKIRVAS